MSAQSFTALDSTIMFLSEEIVEGRYLPGDRLVELDLVERYEVSRSTVRAALLTMSARGIVTIAPTVGASVADLTLEDAATLYELRNLLEPLLVARFTQRATTAQIQALDAAMGRFVETARTSDNLRRIHRARDGFYEVLYDGAGSRAIEQAVRNEYLRLCAYRGAHLSPDDELQRVRYSARFTRGMMPAVLRREPGAASRYSAQTLGEDGASTLRLLGKAS